MLRTVLESGALSHNLCKCHSCGYHAMQRTRRHFFFTMGHGMTLFSTLAGRINGPSGSPTGDPGESTGGKRRAIEWGGLHTASWLFIILCCLQSPMLPSIHVAQLQNDVLRSKCP